MLVCLGQCIVGLSKVLVHLQGVQILDGSFPVFALGAIPLAALQILLLSHVWIAMAPGQQNGRDQEHDHPMSASPIHSSPPFIASHLSCLE